MKSKLIILLSFLLGFSSCSNYIYPPKIEKKTEKEYVYKLNKDYERSKWQRRSIKTGYERYDKKGNVIERGEYGEIKDFTNITKNADSSISIIHGHSRNYKNLNTVYYSQFDNSNKKIADELWQFKDNKKNYLIYKTFFEYDTNGKLLKELEFDRDNKISRIEDYSLSDENRMISKDSVFNFSYEGITRVEGKSQDTIITDSLGRTLEKIHYYKDKFLYRQEFRYDRWENIVTELRYDTKPDSLSCITEWQYNFDKQLIRKFWKIIGSNTETKDIYIYNRDELLKKVLHYDGEELKSYTKYKYKLLK